MITKTPQHLQLRALLMQLISMRTVTDDTLACGEAIEWVKNQVSHLPLLVTELVHNGHPAVILSTRDTKKPKVLLLAHLDVVVGSLEMFDLKIQGGHYLGRGVFDMKGIVAIYIKLLLSLGLGVSKYDLAVAITSDEEMSNKNTAAELVSLGWRPDIVVNPDAVGDWLMERAAKGRMHYIISSSGTSGHSSRPWLYHNAIKFLMNYLTELETKFPDEATCADLEHQHNTFSVNLISGGTVYNQIPESAQAEIELRLMPGQSIAHIDSLIRRLAEDYDGITVNIIASKESLAVNPSNDHVRLFRRLITELTGNQSKLSVSHGASDSEYFIAAGIPTITTGPPGGGHHSSREWISVQGLEQFYLVLAEFINRAAKL